MERNILLDLDIKGLKQVAHSLGHPEYRGKQIWDWLYKGVSDFEQMKNLPEGLQRQLSKEFLTGMPGIIKKSISKFDDTIKYLLKYKDGSIIETVRLVYKFGTTVCVSSQVGCRMGCSFCASTKNGLIRNLTGGEILAQILTVHRDTGDRISNVVIMGSGEPLDNFENVISFIRSANLEEGLGIGLRRITLSTCGLVPEIIELADLGLPINLSLSLHAADDTTRFALMPVAKKYKIKEILQACEYFIKRIGRRVTFEYALIDGLNAHPGDAIRLANLLEGMLCNVNLIPINPTEGFPYKQPGANGIKTFETLLRERGITVTVRRGMGRDISGACGQLRAGYVGDENIRK